MLTPVLTIRFTGPIAAAVAGEITRIRHAQAVNVRRSRHTPRGPGLRDYLVPGEGAAYKAAWDRQGSDSGKHCEAFRRDCLLTDGLIALGSIGLTPLHRPYLSLSQDRRCVIAPRVRA